jgi:hypothetical protein
LALLGCGRVGFGPRAADASVDAPPDAPPVPAMFVQARQPTSGSMPAITTSLDLGANDLVLVSVHWNNSTATVAVSDTLGLAWQPTPQVSKPSGCQPPGNATNLQVFYARVGAGGLDTITGMQSDTSGADPMGMLVVEYAQAGAIDAMSSQVAAVASSNVHAGPINATGPGLVYAVFHDSVGGGTMTAGTGYTARVFDTAAYAMAEDQMIASGGTYDPDGMLPSGKNDACWVGSALVFAAP